jgi:hypothetical protein
LQYPPDLMTRFYIDGCATRRAVALRRRIFKQKKGFANLSLGLNYHSKALPQPPSRDTVPLIFVFEVFLFTGTYTVYIQRFIVYNYLQRNNYALLIQPNLLGTIY